MKDMSNFDALPLKRKRIPFDEMLDPEAHGLQECEHCHGYGSSLKEQAPVCTRCGGTGLVKRAAPAP